MSKIEFKIMSDLDKRYEVQRAKRVKPSHYNEFYRLNTKDKTYKPGDCNFGLLKMLNITIVEDADGKRFVSIKQSKGRLAGDQIIKVLNGKSVYTVKTISSMLIGRKYIKSMLTAFNQKKPLCVLEEELPENLDTVCVQ